MITSLIVVFVSLFIKVFYVLLLLRVVMSWLASPGNQLNIWVTNVTEPILVPIRKVIPQTPGLDLAPLVAFVVLQLIQMAIARYFVV